MSAFEKEKITDIQSTYKTQQERNDYMKSKRRKGLYRRLSVFFILVVIVSYTLISTLISQQAAIKDKVEEKERLNAQLSQMKKDEVDLREEIAKLNNDEYIAKIARRDYYLSDENEIIFTIQDE